MRNKDIENFACVEKGVYALPRGLGRHDNSNVSGLPHSQNQRKINQKKLEKAAAIVMVNQNPLEQNEKEHQI